MPPDALVDLQFLERGADVVFEDRIRRDRMFSVVTDRRKEIIVIAVPLAGLTPFHELLDDKRMQGNGFPAGLRLWIRDFVAPAQKYLIIASAVWPCSILRIVIRTPALIELLALGEASAGSKTRL